MAQNESKTTLQTLTKHATVEMMKLKDYHKASIEPDSVASVAPPKIAVSLLTGGADRPYAFGLGTALISRVAVLDLVGNDELDSPEFYGKPGVNFLNLRGNQRSDVTLLRKIFRVARFYVKLICYAATAEPAIFHILWNNKFESFDRTLLLLYYRCLGKQIVFTAHNVNAGARDSNDTFLNRLSLRVQYLLVHHIFVHTEKMKRELISEFHVRPGRITVIPFGINNAVPNTCLTPAGAKQRLRIREDKRTILFFGNITPYKGLEYLIVAFQQFLACRSHYRLIIVGRPSNCEKYWSALSAMLDEDVRNGRILLRAEFVPDGQTEVYFKAADVLVLPYRYVYQSGVLFLAYSFGLPVLAADVGSLKDEIVDGKTGFVFRPEDPADLAGAIERYFASDLYRELDCRRQEIRNYAMERHSWDVVAQMTVSVYSQLLGVPSPDVLNRKALSPSFDAKAPSSNNLA